MKTTSTEILAALNDSEIENLTAQVNETIFFNFEKAGVKKTLTSADLWNIQRNRKYNRGRKFYQNA